MDAGWLKLCRASFFAWVGLIVLLSTSAYAATTGSLTGTVFDLDGTVLPGAAVEIASLSLISGVLHTLSGADGRFRFSLLPVGAYSAEASMAGFAPSAAEVRVALDRVASITFRMQPLDFSGEIEIGASVPLVDTSQVSTGVVVDDGYLQRATVGVDQRQYLRLTWLAPGVTGQSVLGGTWGDNAYLVDGMNTTDPADGGWGSLFPFDAIQEMSLQTGGYEAEFGLATGGVLNLVTKSGGNQFRGSLDLRWRDPQWVESGEHFDGREQANGKRTASATLGGPVLRDRLWFFVSAEYTEESVQFAGYNFPWERNGGSWIAKLSWQIAPSHRLVLRTSRDPATIVGANAGERIDPSASSTIDFGGPVWLAELNSVLGESVLLNLQAGTFSSSWHPQPTHGDSGRSGHINNDTDVLSHSSGMVWTDDRRRSDLRVNATFFVDDFAGSHEIKAGLEYSDQFFEYTYWLTGGALFFDTTEPPNGDYIDLNGDGYFNDYAEIWEPLETAREPRTTRADVRTLFVQDAWRPHHNLTVKPGIRLDSVQHTNHSGEAVDDLERWQPRLGIAWDLLGDARHVLRLSAGRFMDPSALSLAGFASWDRVVAEYTTLEYFCNLYSICSPESGGLPEPIFFTNGEGIEYVLYSTRGGVSGSWATVDQLGFDRLKAPYADQFVVAYETQLAQETSLELTWITKNTEMLIEDTCIGNEWVWGAAPFPSLDDPDTWTRGGDCSSMVLANIPGLERRYTAYVARLESRTNRSHLLASYTWSDSRSNTVAGPMWYMFDNVDYFPVGFYNHEGFSPEHRRHRLKLNGYLLLPQGWSVAVDAFFASEGHQTVWADCGDLVTALRNPNGRAQLEDLGIEPEVIDYCYSGGLLGDQQIVLTPRGDFQTKSTWQVGVQAARTFQIGGADLTAILSVHNLFNRELDLTFNSQASLQDTDEDDRPLIDDEGLPVYVPIGEPLTYHLPRRYEIGLRLEF